MIAVDYSSIMHRMIAVSVSCAKQNNPLLEGNLQTSDFINLAKHMVLEELLEIQTEFKSYGDLVLCLDDFSKRYWRRDYFPPYKQNRAKGRDESELNYAEIFKEFNELTDIIKKYLPWKVVSVPGAEADDLMLILAREYGSRGEKILLHTPDKDMIQAQINNPMVQQYSALTKKWIVPENKHDSMEHWILEHVFLGDDSDGVPRVIDDTVFSDSFVEHLKSFGVKELTPHEFKNSQMDKDKKKEILSSFSIYKTNRKGEDTELDIYKKERFGPSNLQKILSGEYYNKLVLDDLKEQKAKAKEDKNSELVKELNDKIKNYVPVEKSWEEFLDIYLDSHPSFRPNFERNKILVLEEGIPNNIWNETLAEYISAEAKYDKNNFTNYLDKYNMSSFKTNLSFFEKEELSIDNCGW